MKKIDINNYFKYYQESESDGKESWDIWVLKLNVPKIVQETGLDEQDVMEYVHVHGGKFMCDQMQSLFSQAVKDSHDGWYVTTDVDEQQTWDEDFIELEIKRSLSIFLNKLYEELQAPTA